MASSADRSLRRLRTLAALALLVALLLAGPVLARTAPPAAKPVTPAAAKAPEPIAVVPVRGAIAMITGEGGNIGVLTGAEGTVMVDAKFARYADPIRAAIKGLGGADPRLLINTHFHADHTDGNESFGRGGSTIVAHRNVRHQLAKGSTIEAFQMVTPPAPAAALPVITYADTLRLQLNGETIDLIHVPAAHTDGDSLVVFRSANVIHAGDVWFNGFYPFIDVSHGGTLRGAIAGVDRVLALANDDTRLIAGHGPVGTRAELVEYRAMLATAQERLGRLKARGLAAAQAVAAKPLQDLEARWGDGLFTGDRWIEIIYGGV
jgi:glyoxylase-like metal-dependent hydrolase (beta-lactamase superfamily II)